MKDWSGQFDMSKMTGTLFLAFLASLAVPLSVDRSHTRIIQTLGPRALSLVVLFFCRHESAFPSPDWPEEVYGKERIERK